MVPHHAVIVTCSTASLDNAGQAAVFSFSLAAVICPLSGPCDLDESL